MRHLLLASAILVVMAAPAQAQPGAGGTLERLIKPLDGGLAHYSSYDRTGGNDDWVRIAPGETHTLVNHDGAGIVRRWWITISPRNHTEIQRQLIVRCYWDGEEEPSVEVPVSDFFGMGFGQWKDFISLPVNMTSGGYNTYWPMPFMRGARVTVENTAEVPVEKFYYNVDMRTYDELDDVLYFHAQFRKSITEADEPVVVLDAEGSGHYVGTLMSMEPEHGDYIHYLEGDQRIFIDGEEEPSIIGTGTEDYFSSGWYYDTGEYSAPYHGVTVKDAEEGRINTYRWHIEDPIPFDESLRFTIEHGGLNDRPGVEYATVAFWYQTHPHLPFPPLPEHLMPLARVRAPTIEAEDLLDRADATGGELQVQDMTQWEDGWGGDQQLWWVGAEPGDRLTLPLEVDAVGTYELVAFFTRAPDYGIVRLHVGGQPLGELVDGYAERVESTGPIPMGQVELQQGVNEVVIELVGKDVRSAGYGGGYLVGIDGFMLR